MDKITLQHIFNLAWQAFVVEGKPPSGRDYTCRYETDDGNCCAIGLALPPVMPDGTPRKNLVGAFSAIVRDYPDMFDQDILTNWSPQDLSHFQGMLHDHLIRFWTPITGEVSEKPRWRPGVDLRAEYIRVAEIFGLKVPE